MVINVFVWGAGVCCILFEGVIYLRGQRIWEKYNARYKFSMETKSPSVNFTLS